MWPYDQKNGTLGISVTVTMMGKNGRTNEWEREHDLVGILEEYCVPWVGLEFESWVGFGSPTNEIDIVVLLVVVVDDICFYLHTYVKIEKGRKKQDSLEGSSLHAVKE